MIDYSDILSELDDAKLIIKHNPESDYKHLFWALGENLDDKPITNKYLEIQELVKFTQTLHKHKTQTSKRS